MEAAIDLAGSNEMERGMRHRRDLLSLFVLVLGNIEIIGFGFFAMRRNYYLMRGVELHWWGLAVGANLLGIISAAERTVQYRRIWKMRQTIVAPETWLRVEPFDYLLLLCIFIAPGIIGTAFMTNLLAMEVFRCAQLFLALAVVGAWDAGAICLIIRCYIIRTRERNSS
jgi:hypothetical protein